MDHHYSIRDSGSKHKAKYEPITVRDLSSYENSHKRSLDGACHYRSCSDQCEILLGIVCGFYSIYYSYTLSLASRFLRMLGNVWLRGALCGLGLGIVIMMFPAMFGEGYDVVSNIVNGVYYRLVEYGPFFRDLPRLPLLLGIITAMLLLKGAVVGAVNSGGGVAGEFVPAIFAGCLLGFMFASVREARESV